MNCRSVRKAIEEHIAAKGMPLSDSISGHIDSCPSCLAYLGQLLEMRTALDLSREHVRPGELDDMTFEKIAALAGARKYMPRGISIKDHKLRWALAPVALAAAIVVAVLIPEYYNRPDMIIAANGASDQSSNEIINEIATSESLGTEILADMAIDLNFDNIADELMREAEFNDLLYGLTQSELEALNNKIDDLPRTGRSGKG
jgi:hypothetical protein